MAMPIFFGRSLFSIIEHYAPTTDAGDDAALGGADEIDEFANLGRVGNIFLDVLDHARVEPVKMDGAIHPANGVDRFPAHAGALAPDGVVTAQSAIGQSAKRRHFLVHAFVSPDDRKPTDANKLMQRATPAEERLFEKFAMPAQQHAVGEDHRVVKDAVVSHVDTAHDEAVVADLGCVFDSAVDGAVDRGGFPNGDVVTDDEMTDVAIGLEMLGRQSHKGGRSYFTVVADGRRTTQMRVFVNDRSGSDAHRSLDNAVRSDRDIICKFCPGVDQRGRMKFGHKNQRVKTFCPGRYCGRLSLRVKTIAQSARVAAGKSLRNLMDSLA
jgi:hypothetical protein